MCPCANIAVQLVSSADDRTFLNYGGYHLDVTKKVGKALLPNKSSSPDALRNDDPTLACLKDEQMLRKCQLPTLCWMQI